MPPFADLLPGDNDGNYELPLGNYPGLGLPSRIGNDVIDQISGGDSGSGGSGGSGGPPLSDLMPGDNDGNYELPGAGLIGIGINEGIDQISGGNSGGDGGGGGNSGGDGSGGGNNGGVQLPGWITMPSVSDPSLPSLGGGSGSGSGSALFAPIGNAISSVGQTTVLAAAAVALAWIVTQAGGQSDG